MDRHSDQMLLKYQRYLEDFGRDCGEYSHPLPYHRWYERDYDQDEDEGEGSYN